MIRPPCGKQILTDRLSFACRESYQSDCTAFSFIEAAELCSPALVPLLSLSLDTWTVWTVKTEAFAVQRI